MTPCSPTALHGLWEQADFRHSMLPIRNDIFPVYVLSRTVSTQGDREAMASSFELHIPFLLF